jgi:uncharacterized membrane protein
MDLRGLFDAFYDKLILRDVFGKMVPGVALMATVLASLLGLDTVDHLLSRMTTILWLVVVGFSWLIGFALQYVGEVCRALRICPPDPDGQYDRDAFHECWAKFHEVATPIEHVHAERLNIIKEACGNASVAIVCGLVVVLFAVSVKGASSWYPLMPLAAISAALSFSLWRMHVIHVQRYGTFVRMTIKFHERSSQKQ